MRVGLVINLTKNYKEEIRHAKELGFECGQLLVWDPNFYTEENLLGLKQVMEEVRFEAVGFWCGWRGPMHWKHPEKYYTLGLVPDHLRQTRMEELYKGADFAYKLGIDTITTHIGFFPDDPFHPTHLAIVQCLKKLCGDLKERGQRFSFETGQEIPVSLSILIGEIGLDNVGVNFDPSNLLTSGRANPNDAMEHLGCCVMGMHAKDGVPPKFGECEGKQVPIGEGRVDFKRLLVQLKEVGYKGDMVIEHELSGRADRDADLVASKKYLENLIEEVGI